jgi:subtilisin-like proprotein convertase family protein
MALSKDGKTLYPFLEGPLVGDDPLVRHVYELERLRAPHTGVGYPSKVGFSIDGTACTEDAGATTVGIDHTYVGDLTGTLTSPSNTTAVLFQRRGGTGENLCQVVFDDAAANPFASVLAADDPFTGTWRPQDPLATLTGETADGTWTFKVTDGAASDTGSVRAFTLSLTGFVQ